jgi:hypothetical protein
MRNSLAFLLGCVSLVIGVAELIGQSSAATVQGEWSHPIALFWIVVGAALIILTVSNEIRSNWK